MYRMFIADDLLVIVNGLKILCDWESMGIEIIGTATSGKKAEEEIIRLEPDLVLLDIRMPKRSGIDILNTIKEKKMKCKVIIISAYTEFEYARNALEAGAFNYLVKPVNKEKLITSVENAIAQIEADATAKEAITMVTQLDKQYLLRRQKQRKPMIKEFIQSQKNEIIKDLIRYMYKNFSKDISLEEMAEQANMNPQYFSVFFKKNSGLKFKDCLTRIKLEHAMEKLKTKTNLKSREIGEYVGFNDPGYFAALFKKYYGMTPTEFKKES